MLPWNPPSSFSLGGDQHRFGYPGPDQQSGGPQGQQPNSQQQSPLQPQQQQSPGGHPLPPPGQQAYPPMTLAATLHFLQSEHRRYARDRNEWEIERAEMRARIALLEGEKRGNEAALKSLGRRCKMLEMALRGERSKFLSTTNALAGSSPSVSGTASPVPGAAPTLPKDTSILAHGGIPPGKLAALHKEAGGASTAPAAPSTPAPAEPPKSAPMTASTSSPGQAAGLTPAAAAAAAPVNGFSSGTWSSAAPGSAAAGAATASGRDPRGKARSREYLKQCLQEITYLTSSATLNPLAAHSYAAPSVPRPRKVLPDQVPPASGPGVINLGGAGGAPAGSAQTGEVPPLAGADPSAASAAPAAPSSVLPPVPASSAAAPPTDTASKPDLLSSFPSDPPSAFVPLRRQISQPGQPGSVRAGNPQREDEMDRAIAELSAPAPSAAAEEGERKPQDSSAAPEGGDAPQLAPKDEIVPEPLVDEVLNAAPGAAGEKAAPGSADGASAGSGETDPFEKAQEAAPEANEEKPGDADAETAVAAAGEEEKGAEQDPFEPVAESSLKKDDNGTLQLAGSSASIRLVNTNGPSAGSRAGTLARGRAGRSALGGLFGAGDEGGAGDVERGDGTAANSSSGGEGGEGGAARMNGAEGADADGDEEVPTAIFRPEAGDAEAWRTKLREAGRRAYPGFAGKAGVAASATGGDAELHALERDLEGSDEGDGEDEGEAGAKSGRRRREKQGSEETVGLKDGERFVPHKVLKSHLDAVRAVVCLGPAGGGLADAQFASASDDLTIKIWRGVDGARVDHEPTMTLRGHTAPVTALAIIPSSSSTSDPTLFSASLDSTIRVWALPVAPHKTYDPVDPTVLLGVLEPNADAVWGLATFAQGDRIACITADGAIQVWDWQEGKMLASWTYGTDGTSDDAPTGSLKKRLAPQPTPIAVTVVSLESDDGAGVKELLAVAFQNAVVKLFDPSTGDEAQRLEADKSSDGGGDAQVNALAAHPTLPLLATAHEDRYIRIFDLKTGACLVSHLAHLDGVTSLAFSPADMSSSTAEQDILLASTSHDTSLRLWKLQVAADGTATLVCVQEASSHRVKGVEGVLDVTSVPNGTALVTSGADGTVRVWKQ
ncbi:hypothetical protein Rhopal_007655-T1 [Rhodotorula paludigena]|uniref:Striatin N-terminal domain-containing protein n=1 Tax=Rhodotorula paludigena TaxID=86838 RepID=A0AAV5GYY6_9BASI|nr:hypothetical protein Rhopal_007655-T1 [Rhodotorula paludigena]